MGTEQHLAADYVIIGGGAMGMAFADVILAESEASVMIIDRHGKPGGHWNDAYPFVRLHQPSAFYGVNSRQLGADRVDTHGLNQGLYELASGAEVVAYYDQLLHQHFLPSGRVQYLPLSEVDVSTVRADSNTVSVRSLATGGTVEVKANKRVVNATYMNVSVPSQRAPGYAVADGLRFGPINSLASLSEPADGYVVVGAGKTGADACLFLLANGVDPDAIQWITPRDSWFLDRAMIQPGEFRETSGKFFIDQFRHVAESTSIADVFDRLEANGLLLRLDPDVQPTMYRCSTITKAELEQLKRITNIVRLGRVQQIDADQIVLDDGAIPTTANTFHVDCTADGLERRPARQVFDDRLLTLQTVRTCQQVFSAAFIAHAEVAYDNDDHRNMLCGVVPHPDAATDWLRSSLGNSMNSANWNADPELVAWLSNARLDGFSSPEPPSEALMELMMSALDFAEPALAKLQAYVAELDAVELEAVNESA